jgi:hypothetical protein
MLLLTAALLVHSWYPRGCCGDQHCRPVPCEDISKSDSGYIWNGWHFDLVQVQASQDQSCHVCIIGSFPACLFVRLDT